MGYNNRGFSSSEVVLEDKKLYPIKKTQLYNELESNIQKSFDSKISSDECFNCSNMFVDEKRVQASIISDKKQSTNDTDINFSTMNIPMSCASQNTLKSDVSVSGYVTSLSTESKQSLVQYNNITFLPFVVLEAVASSIIQLISGCFGCNRAKEVSATYVGRLDAEQQKGAWFDCEQMRINQGSCYTNPVTIDSDGAREDSCFKGTISSIPHASYSKSKENSVNSPLDPVDYIDYINIEDDRKRDFNCTAMTAKQNNGVNSETCDILFETKGMEQISFATQLEKDYKHRRPTNERSESYVLNTGYVAENLPSRSKLNEFYTDIKLENENLKYSGEDQSSHCDSSILKHIIAQSEPAEENIFNDLNYKDFDTDNILTDVWEDYELEEAFGIYNLNAFYSYGSTSPIVLGSRPSKPANEKYEEVFPANKQSYLGSSPHLEAHPHTEIEREIETVPATTVKKESEELDERKWISNLKLNNIISQFLTLGRDECFNTIFSDLKETLNYDNYFIYMDKRITKLLLFDLVNEQRLFSDVNYPVSSSIKVNCLPVATVKRNVFRLLETPKPHECGRKGKCDILAIQKHENDAIVDTLVKSSLKQEEPFWNNYEREEFVRKNSVYEEILEDLLLETVTVFKRKLFSMKANSSTSVEHDNEKDISLIY